MEKASDTYWERALSLFKALSPEQQEIFFEVMRQVAVDTTSSVLGVIDGITINAELALVSCDDRLTISGELQSLFFAEEEQYLQ